MIKSSFLTFLRILCFFAIFFIQNDMIGYNKKTNTNNNLQKGFVYLKDINPKIISNLMYYDDFNFVNKRIDGYKSNNVILTKEAAEALNNAWKLFQKDGYNLLIYDTYRPQKAVNHFIRWAAEKNDNKEIKKIFFPYIEHSDAFKLGYIVAKSGHTRGSAIDLTIMKNGANPKSLKDSELVKRTLNDGREILYINNGSVDMGSSLDLMDEASWSNSKLVSEEAQKNRQYFIKIMSDAGFENYKTEWWHFTFKNEPFPDTYFDFDLE